MSSLWTPGGEHPVGDDRGGTEPPSAPPEAGPDPLADLSPEERAQYEEMAEQMAEAQQRLLEAPAEGVVGNHAVGLYQLALIHLSTEDPDLEAARLAIDGMAGLLNALEGRLGDDEPTLRDALGQAQMAFVQVQQREGGGPA
mgnify:CR=1 FL=1